MTTVEDLERVISDMDNNFEDTTTLKAKLDFLLEKTDRESNMELRIPSKPSDVVAMDKYFRGKENG